ncbi:hypothetical protein QL285_070055 [Trifolium repens]|jgi:hypothetical protein|nr:hypothetical protein QL285_070055 [Trifolium repens]
MEEVGQKSVELHGEKQVGSMSQEAVEELRKGQELLKEEVNQLKIQMSLITQILLKGEGDHFSNSPQAYTAPQPWVIPPSQLQKNQQQPRQQAPQPFNQQKRVKRTPQFDPIPMTYSELLPTLLEKNLVQVRAPPRVPATLPRWYRSDHFCAFHQGAPGHDIERCFALKAEVQRLVGENILSFKHQGPNA